MMDGGIYCSSEEQTCCYSICPRQATLAIAKNNSHGPWKDSAQNFWKNSPLGQGASMEKCSPKGQHFAMLVAHENRRLWWKLWCNPGGNGCSQHPCPSSCPGAAPGISWIGFYFLTKLSSADQRWMLCFLQKFDLEVEPFHPCLDKCLPLVFGRSLSTSSCAMISVGDSKLQGQALYTHPVLKTLCPSLYCPLFVHFLSCSMLCQPQEFSAGSLLNPLG